MALDTFSLLENIKSREGVVMALDTLTLLEGRQEVVMAPDTFPLLERKGVRWS